MTCPQRRAALGRSGPVVENGAGPQILVPNARGAIVLIDQADADRVLARRWMVSYSKAENIFDCFHFINRKSEFSRKRLSRFILCATDAQIVDHINGNRLDNRRQNLRIVTQQQNTWNRRKANNAASAYKGVCPLAGSKSKPWRAYIHMDRKQKHLGLFATEIEAARVYDEAARSIFGQFAAVNFPRIGEQSAHLNTPSDTAAYAVHLRSTAVSQPEPHDHA